MKALKEALKSRRTLAYGYNTICGDEQLLKDFFAASVKVNVVRTSSKTMYLTLTNMTSIPYTICKTGQNQNRLDPFSTIMFAVSKESQSLRLTVLNMFCSKNAHPVVELPLQ